VPNQLFRFDGLVLNGGVVQRGTNTADELATPVDSNICCEGARIGEVIENVVAWSG